MKYRHLHYAYRGKSPHDMLAIENQVPLVKSDTGVSLIPWPTTTANPRPNTSYTLVPAATCQEQS